MIHNTERMILLALTVGSVPIGTIQETLILCGYPQDRLQIDLDRLTDKFRLIKCGENGWELTFKGKVTAAILQRA